MGSISSPGIGSGINVNQLVSQLVAAERAPQEQRIARRETDARADLTAFNQIKTALSSLRTAANALDGSSGVAGRKATIQADAGFTATATSAAALGRYTIEVESLATAQKRQSGPVTTSADLGTGTLSFTVGTETFNVTLGATNTITQLRDAINTATAGKGLAATVVNGDSGSVLVLNAAKAGTAGAITINATGSIATFTNGLAVTTTATNAVVKVDGVTRTADSNRLTDLIGGVTIDLTKAQDNSTFTLDIVADNANVRTAMQSFVGAYNAALTQLRNASAFNAETRVGGPLVGDAAVRGLQQQLRGAIGDAFDELSTLGIKSSKDGSLSIDVSKFDAALAASPSAVERLFDKEIAGSLGAVLSARLEGAVAPNTGLLDARTKALNDRLKGLLSDRERLDVRISRIEDNYRRQFTALDGLVSQLQSTSSFLTQELARLPGAG
ncbi:flagellar filament capping protein FliD [Silanimonas sp.]|jgi:flagellar hook-associated protein 2|uniref:flagellar filament capping protein FliD n=1 Tax=Silanimonas sp. TaxID=1929290 RepID=UPI0022C29AE9|nr:flagellar filament capping protein FliD [Silanimonas sp.]MCZ8062134.1 flagellar filament capping protein FliD [Silanimonas sp.]